MMTAPQQPFDATLAALAAAEPQPILYDRADWLERTARLVTGRDGCLLLEAERSWLPLVTRGIGRAEALASWYTLAFRPITAGAAAIDDLARAARARRFARIDLSPVPNWDGSATNLAAVFRAAGWFVQMTEATGNWVHPLGSGGFDGFLAARPGRLRSTIRRRSREGMVLCTLHHEVTPTLWAEWRAVFEASWKGPEGSLRFLHEWMIAASSDGTLRLGVARVGDQAVAVQFWTVEHNVATIHKLALREDARNLSPGTLLSAALFRHAIDVDRVRLIDYGNGDDAYKRDWMTMRRRLMRVTLTDVTTPVGRAWRLRDRTARLVRPLRAR